MEVFLLIFVFAGYIALRVALGAAQDPISKEKKKHAKGLQLIRNKEYGTAIEYWTAVLQKEPRNAVALASRGRAYAGLHEYYQALADLSRATTIEYRMGDAYLDKGRVLMQLHEYDNAYLEMDKACWHLRDCAEAFRYRGLLNLRLNQEARAAADFKRAVELGDEDSAHLLTRLSRQTKGS